MLGRGHGVKEAATQADVIKLFPTTAFSVWQDALYKLSNVLLFVFSQDVRLSF
jgi:hypothetical protein